MVLVKILIVLSVLLGGFYFGVTKVISAQADIAIDQANNLKDFYSNMDQYAADAVSGQNSGGNPYVPQSLNSASQPPKNSPTDPFVN